jgi:protein-S-isoprenylcysteine O-methyltransferase Ste14
MLTEEENRFIEYWEANRLRRKRLAKQVAIGLPFGVILVIAIFLSFVSGWDKQAKIELNSQTQTPSEASLILVLVIAALLIAVFTAVFSARHKWDRHEQRYRELLVKKDQP